MGLNKVLIMVIYNGNKQSIDQGNTCTVGLGNVLAKVILAQWS